MWYVGKCKCYGEKASEEGVRDNSEWGVLIIGGLEGLTEKVTFQHVKYMEEVRAPHG